MAALTHLRLGFPRFRTNPVLKRELLTLLRRPASFFYFLAFLLVLWLVLLNTWSEQEDLYYRNIRSTFFLFAAFQTGCLLLIVPVISATSVNVEIERDTWDLLRTTHIRSFGIFYGKLLTTIAYVLVLVFSTVPFYSILTIFGGISPKELILIHVTMMECVVMTGLIGMTCSVFFRHPVTAVTAAYAASFVYIIGLFVGAVVFSEYFKVPLLWGGVLLLSPLYPIVAVTASPAPAHMLSPLLQPLEIEIHTALTLLHFLFLFGLCMRRARRQGDPQAATERTLHIQTFGFRSYFLHVKPIVDHESLSISDHANPVYCKDFRETEHRRRLFHYGITLALLVLGIVLCAYQQVHYKTFSQLDELIYWPVLLAPFFVIPYAVNTIRGERDRDTLDLLQTTLLGSWKILWGKVHAGMRLFAWRYIALYGIILISAFAFLWDFREPVGFLAWTPFNHLNLFVSVAILGFVWSFFYISAGIFFSAFSSKTTTAYVKTILFLVVILFPHILLEIYSPGGFPLFLDTMKGHTVFIKMLSGVSPLYLIEVYLQYAWRRPELTGGEWYSLCFRQAWWLILASGGFLWLANIRLRRLE